MLSDIEGIVIVWLAYYKMLINFFFDAPGHCSQFFVIIYVPWPLSIIGNFLIISINIIKF